MVVCKVSRLPSGIHVLTILTKYQTYPHIPVRPKDITIDVYRFVYASVSGNGGSIEPPQNNGYNPECIMKMQAGMWVSDMSKSSSNHIEFWNLVK